jgi:hypothetical protein
MPIGPGASGRTQQPAIKDNRTTIEITLMNIDIYIIALQ